MLREGFINRKFTGLITKIYRNHRCCGNHCIADNPQDSAHHYNHYLSYKKNIVSINNEKLSNPSLVAPLKMLCF